MRKHIAAGNWKMNLSATEAQTLTSEILTMVEAEYHGQAEVVFAPPFPYLSLVHHLTKGASRFHLAAQNMHQEVSGAFTGETSVDMIRAVGASHVLIGHSERRQYFGETNELLARKVDLALAKGLTPIYCLGETLAEREAGRTLDVNREQLHGGLFHLSAEDFGRVVIAYEPVWAIGTGKTASPDQAQEVHTFLRQEISGHYGSEVADNCSLLYGGSVKASNAKELFSQPDIDGGLVGGASLQSREFTEIIKALP